MATIGLDKLYYAKITEDASGNETLRRPPAFGKGHDCRAFGGAGGSYAVCGRWCRGVVKEFQSGTLTLGVDDIGVTVAQDLTGATIDGNKVLVSTSEDGGTPVAVGFRAKKANGKYRYFWLYRVKFGIPATNLTTKGREH